MNLIEKLGGYEKAKNIRLGNEEDWMFYSIKKDWYSDIKHDDSFIFIDELKYKLCEHRREHSIFEVGDRVTHLTTRDILKVVSFEDSNKHYRFIEVVSATPKNDGSVSDEFNSLWFQLKHATDVEIKAGHRISHATDNLSHFDHCSDIRNHVSPNTVVVDHE